MTKVPGKCVVSIDRRLTVGESRETVQESMSRLLSDLKGNDGELRVDADYPYSYEAILTPADHPALRSIDKAHRETTGKPAEIGFIPFGTDGAWINKMTGCPIIIYGPGNIANAHRPNEYVEVSQVIEASMVYASLLVDYLS